MPLFSFSWSIRRRSLWYSDCTCFSYGGNIMDLGECPLAKTAKNVSSCISIHGPMPSFTERTELLYFSCLQFSFGDKTYAYENLTSSKNQLYKSESNDGTVTEWEFRGRGPWGRRGRELRLRHGRSQLRLEGWPGEEWRRLWGEVPEGDAGTARNQTCWRSSDSTGRAAVDVRRGPLDSEYERPWMPHFFS